MSATPGPQPPRCGRTAASSAARGHLTRSLRELAPAIGDTAGLRWESEGHGKHQKRGSRWSPYRGDNGPEHAQRFDRRSTPSAGSRALRRWSPANTSPAGWGCVAGVPEAWRRARRTADQRTRRSAPWNCTCTNVRRLRERHPALAVQGWVSGLPLHGFGDGGVGLLSSVFRRPC